MVDLLLLGKVSPLEPIEQDPCAWFRRALDDHDINADTCNGDITELTIDWQLAVVPLVPSRYA